MGFPWTASDRSSFHGLHLDGHMANERLEYEGAKHELLDQIEETLIGEIRRNGVDTKTFTALVMFFILFAPLIEGSRGDKVKELMMRLMPETLALAEKYNDEEVDDGE